MTMQLVIYWTLVILKKIINDPQQINLIGKLLRNTGATIFFIIKNPEETTFNFSQNSVATI